MSLSIGSSRSLGSLVSLLVVSACTVPAPAISNNNKPSSEDLESRVALGRQVVLTHDCGGCHGGRHNPANFGWLDGNRSPIGEFQVGPYVTRAKNLTPDNMTGIGRFTERQIFNALRYGLRPEETADVEITSTIPGEGNFPLHPHYLAPPMPWPSWRHMPDQELYAIAAYLKNGVQPVKHKVEDSQGPADFWASFYEADSMGPRPALPFPTARERRVR